MVVDQSSIVRSTPGSVFKNALVIERVDGGESTNPLWTSEVGNDAFRGALSASLVNSGLMATKKARFQLFARLASVNQPFIGLDMTVRASVIYRVLETETKKIWFDHSVSTPYTATFSDAPIGIVRLRLANEGSIRENIKEFIRRLIEIRSPKLTGSSISMPKPAAAATKEPIPSKDIAERLKQLNALFKQELISKDEYERKRQEILKGI